MILVSEPIKCSQAMYNESKPTRTLSGLVMDAYAEFFEKNRLEALEPIESME